MTTVVEADGSAIDFDGTSLTVHGIWHEYTEVSTSTMAQHVGTTLLMVLKAWNNTNNTGTTINESFNISSLTDTNTGRQNQMLRQISIRQLVVSNEFKYNYNQQWVDGLQANTWKTNNYDGSAYQDAGVTVAFGDGMTHGHLWMVAEAKTRLDVSLSIVCCSKTIAPDEPAKVLVLDPNWMACIGEDTATHRDLPA